jgi:hypothetical protein
MRELKYRVWDKYNKRMRIVDSIDWNHLEVSVLGKGKEYISGGIQVSSLDESGSTIYLREEPGEPVPLMQWTGLYDKNKTPIYEGDILGLDDPEDKSRMSVVFKRGGFKGNFIGDDGYEVNPDIDNLWVVIGNIHAHPHLLKETP